MTEKKKQPRKPKKVVEHGVPAPARIPKHQAWVPLRWMQRGLSVVAFAMSEDRTRPHLAGLSIAVAGDNVVMRATQGHWLIEYSQPLPKGFKHSGEIAFFLTASMVKRLLVELAEVAEEHVLFSAITLDSGAKYESTPPRDPDAEWTKTIHHPPCVVFDSKLGTYEHALGTMKLPTPDQRKEALQLAKSFPKLIAEATNADARDAPFGVDGQYLVLATKAIGKVQRTWGKSVQLRVTVRNPESAMLIEPANHLSCGGSIKIVVMPVRIG